MSVNAQAVRKAIFTPQFVTALLVGLIVGVAGFGILFRPVALQEASLQFQRPYPMPHQYWATTDEFYVFASLVK